MRNRRKHFLPSVFLIALLYPCLAPSAHGAQVRLRNDLSPGAYTRYDVSVSGVRRTQTQRYEEVLSFTQTGRLSLLVFGDSQQQPRSATRAWMMQLDEPVVTSLTRAGQPVEELPHPKLAGLPPRVVQLRVGEIISARAEASAVGGSRVQRAAMLLALDFSHWPKDVISTGHEWSNTATRPELAGTWQHRYSRTEGRRAKRLAVGSFEFEGALTGEFKGVASIKSVRGEWRWLISKRSLQSVQSRVVLEYGPEVQGRVLELEVSLKLADRSRLPKDELRTARAEIKPLTVLARRALRTGADDAKAELKAFIADHPDSLWLPVARDVLERASLEARTINTLSEDQLVDVLVSLVRRWQRAAGRNEVEKLEPLRSTYRELMESNGDAMRTLTRSDEANIRAMAAFATAFAKHPKHLQRVIELTQDEEPRVRAWAAYGLAERRDQTVDASVWFRLLEDSDRNVRLRACMAVETCVGATHPERRRLIRRLLVLVAKDDQEQVQVRSAKAVSAIAIAADLPDLIEAEATCDTPPARRILEATIRKLGGTPKDPLDDD